MTPELAALHRIADPVLGQPRLENTQADNGFTQLQLAEIAADVQPYDDARTAAEASVTAAAGRHPSW